MWTIVAFMALFVNVFYLVATGIQSTTLLRKQIRSQLVIKTFELDTRVLDELEPLLSPRDSWIQLASSLSLVFCGFLYIWYFFTLGGLTF